MNVGWRWNVCHTAKKVPPKRMLNNCESVSHYLYQRFCSQCAFFFWLASRGCVWCSSKYLSSPAAIYVFLTTRETLPVQILRNKARILRKRTGDQRWRAPEKNVPLKQIYKTSLTKVIKFLFTEPLVTFNTIYLAILYCVSPELLCIDQLTIYIRFGHYRSCSAFLKVPQSV